MPESWSAFRRLEGARSPSNPSQMRARKRWVATLMHPPPGIQIGTAIILTAALVLAGERLILGLAGVTPAVKQSWLAMADVSVAAGLFALTFMLYRMERQRDRPRFEIRKARISFGGEDPSGGMSLFFEIANRGGVDSCLDEETLLIKIRTDSFKPILDFSGTGIPNLVAAGHETDQHPLMIRVGHIRQFEAWFTDPDNHKLFALRGADATLWLDPVAGGYVAPKTFTFEPGDPPVRSVIFYPDLPPDEAAAKTEPSPTA